MPAPKVQYSVNGSRLCFVGIREVSSKRWGRRGEAEGAGSTNPCVRMGAESSPLCSALLHGECGHSAQRCSAAVLRVQVQQGRARCQGR